MKKQPISQWHKDEAAIIKRMRKLCKMGVLIELPIFRGIAKARFVDATNLKPCRVWNGKRHGQGCEYSNGFKVTVYTVSRGSGVIRTWIPVESVRFQNDGCAGPLSAHTADGVELSIHRHKLTTLHISGFENMIKDYVERYKTMVANGGTDYSDGAFLRLLDEYGVDAGNGIREIFNKGRKNWLGSGVGTGAAQELDKAAFEALKKMGIDHATYPEYYMGYPVSK